MGGLDGQLVDQPAELGRRSGGAGHAGEVEQVAVVVELSCGLLLGVAVLCEREACVLADWRVSQWAGLSLATPGGWLLAAGWQLLQTVVDNGELLFGQNCLVFVCLGVKFGHFFQEIFVSIFVHIFQNIFGDIFSSIFSIFVHIFCGRIGERYRVRQRERLTGFE